MNTLRIKIDADAGRRTMYNQLCTQYLPILNYDDAERERTRCRHSFEIKID